MTEKKALPACLDERCEECGFEASAGQHGSVFREQRITGWHDYAPHEHVKGECSAAFYETVFGCEVFRGADGVPTYCIRYGDKEHLERVHVGTGWTWGTVPDIIYAPESNTSKLAMFDVLAEIKRRGWFYLIDEAAERFTVWKFEAPLPHGRGKFTDETELPRAATIALWLASHTEREEGA